MRLFCLFLAGVIGIAGAQTPQARDPRSLTLVGDRFKPLTYDAMTPEQKTMIEHLLAGERRGAGGPYNVLLRSPEVGDLAQQFGGAMRFRASLPRDVSETVIIMTGRFWMAQYEWNAHKAAALQNGVNAAIVDAIASGRRPTGMSPDVEIAYNFMDELLTSHHVSDATYKAAKDRYGEKGVVDMIQLSGWYTLVSTTLNVDRYPLAAGVQAELKALENPLPVAGAGLATGIPGKPAPSSISTNIKGKAITLSGDRLQPLSYDQMDPAQKKMAETMAAGRGPGGSFNIIVRSPDAGSLFYDMGERVRFHMSVPDKLKEIAILLTARYWTAHFEWQAHRRAAAQAGFGEEKIKAIAEGRRPEGMSSDEAAVYNFVTELYKTKGVSDGSFAALKSVVGERGVVDILVTAGYYQVVSMGMNVDRFPLGAGQQPELKYMARPLP